MMIIKKHLSRRTFIRGTFGSWYRLEPSVAMVPVTVGTVALNMLSNEMAWRLKSSMLGVNRGIPCSASLVK